MKILRPHPHGVAEIWAKPKPCSYASQCVHGQTWQRKEQIGQRGALGRRLLELVGRPMLPTALELKALADMAR